MDKAASLSLSLEQGAIDILLLLQREGGQLISEIQLKTGLTTEEVREFTAVMKRNQMIKQVTGFWKIRPDGINYLRDRNISQ